MGKSIQFSAVIAAACLILTMPAGGGTSEVVDRIVAVVNDDIITLQQLNDAVAPYLAKVNNASYPEEKRKKIVYNLKKDMLNRMIERTLADQEAKKYNITVSETEVDKAIERFKENRSMTQMELEKGLKQDGMTFSEYRDKIRKEILRPKLISRAVNAKVVVTDSEVKSYYEKHRDKYAGIKKYELRNILAEEKEKMERARSFLEQGGDFETAAEKFSEASNASEKGHLGVFKAESFSEKLKNHITSCRPGEYTDIIETDRGFQIFYVENIEKVGGKSLKEAREAIVETLYDKKASEKFDKWMESLKENSHIKTML
ncbi:MAG: SurA N-terminal domain-containing protein [Desulfarculaceae bacterium]|nr:SurA N-terminal domain-containing protein [Desulfarculaceae bacterium]